MPPNRSFLVITLLGASSMLRAASSTTETPPADPGPDKFFATDIPAAPAPSQNVTVNLINRLVQKGILTQDEAGALIKQAEADVAIAARNAAAQAQALAQAEVAALPPPNADDVRVTYIPEVVRNNMRDEIKQELMAQAREEKWSEKAAPAWTSKFRPFGDIRVRYENSIFPDGNDNTGAFPNFNAINTGAPYDVNNVTQFAPRHRHHARRRFQCRHPHRHRR